MVYLLIQKQTDMNTLESQIGKIDFNLEYEGYYWYSGSEQPVVIRNKKIDPSIFTDLPFIIEGAFYCSSSNVSIRVRNIDGAYIISQFNLKDSNADHLDEKTYFSHDIEGGIKYKLVEAWKAELEPEMENMEILRPAWSAFKGFC